MIALSQNSTQERILVRGVIVSEDAITKGSRIYRQHSLATHSAWIVCLNIDHGIWFGSYGLMVDGTICNDNLWLLSLGRSRVQS